MQLLVYARNYATAAADGEGRRTFVGLAIGEAPQVLAASGAGTPTSFIEVRVPAQTLDLVTAVPLLVAKAIAREPRANRRAVVLSCTEGVVRMRLEESFADARTVCAPLMPLLQRCRVWGDTVTTRPVVTAVSEATSEAAAP